MWLFSFYSDFEHLATEVLNKCHHKDPDKAMMLAERKSPCWNEMTCLQIAAAAIDQKFLSSVACQESMNVIWKHGIIISIFKVSEVFLSRYKPSALDKLLGQMGIYATWLSSIAYMQIFIFFTPRFFSVITCFLIA